MNTDLHIFGEQPSTFQASESKRGKFKVGKILTNLLI